jgi:hypothetical protein
LQASKPRRVGIGAALNIQQTNEATATTEISIRRTESD